MKKKIVLKNQDTQTSIIFRNNHIKKYLENLFENNSKVICIVDKKVNRLVKNIVLSKDISIIYIEGGEKIKSFQSYVDLSQKILSKNIDRETILVAVGGGTIGDLCGFISGTLLRGIKYNLIPTTLLSQVDSSIGGKNGINTKHGKNLVGVFYQPNEILIDVSALKSLPIREIRSGYAEIVKHSLIRDKKFFQWLDKNYKKIFKINTKIIEKAILKSIMIKLWYVKKDPKEKLINHNSRAMLNFGHTFGHAIETLNKYNKMNHGEAISIGMIIEAKLSNKLGYLNNLDLNKIIDHFSKTKIKKYYKDFTHNELLKIISKDKKNVNNKINIVLLKKIGNAFFKRNMEIDIFKLNIRNI